MSKIDYFAKLAFFRYTSEIVILISAFLYSYMTANFLGPEEYGLISYFLLFMASLPNVFGFGAVYDALKVYSAKAFSKKFIGKILIIAFSFLLLLTVLAVILSQNIISFLGKGSVDLVIFTSIIIFLVPTSLLFQSVFSGLKIFGKLLKLTLLEKILDLFFLVFFLFYLNQGMLSILYAKVTVSLIVISASIYYYKKSVDSKKKVSVSDFKLFMKMSVIANVVAGWAKQAEIWVALSFLTPINLGLLYLLQRIETYFFEMPSNALSEVALPFFSEVSEKKDKSIGYANLIIKFQFILNILESIFFVLVAPFFVLFLFPEYAGMTNYFIIVSISFLFNFSAVLARFVRSIERNDLLLNIALLNFVLILVLGILLIPQYGLLGAVLTFAIKRVLISLYSFFALKQIGYSFTFIPNKSDLMLFWKTFLSLISRFARFLRLK